MKLGLFTKILLAFIIFFLLSYFLPIVHVLNIDSLLASATFLFGVLYGFEISIVLDNFSKLKSLLATENAGVLSIYHLSRIIGGSFAENVEKRIEAYLKKSIDVPLNKHLLETNNELFAIFEPLKNVKVSGIEKEHALYFINQGLTSIPQSRAEIAQVAPKDVEDPEWAMLLMLASIIVGTLFVAREASLISQVASAIFATTLVGALLLLEEVDSNHLQEARLENEVFNETLVAMGKERYSPKQ
ncbi:MAG TPA: hypothetical protein VLG67_00920 [Candidatus Saccharimonadales bacterium]|nr:hypothetical protein [Candidatus Saccharimonadales bacterium]